jgi:hypothetical protein
MRTIVGLAMAILSAASFSNSSFAEGALAIGMVEGDPAKGFRHSKTVNDPNAAAEAMKDCRAARSPKVGAACILIGTFADQCAAIAVNGDAANTNAPIIAAGWAIAPDRDKASSRAIAQCEAMRKGRRSACQVEGKILCDGAAK